MLREFFSLMNFYHRCLPHGSSLLHPLNDLLNIFYESTKELPWTDSALAAFSKAKEALAEVTLLFYPAPYAPSNIMTDASEVAISAVSNSLMTNGARSYSSHRN